MIIAVEIEYTPVHAVNLFSEQYTHRVRTRRDSDIIRVRNALGLNEVIICGSGVFISTWRAWKNWIRFVNNCRSLPWLTSAIRNVCRCYVERDGIITIQLMFSRVIFFSGFGDGHFSVEPRRVRGSTVCTCHARFVACATATSDLDADRLAISERDLYANLSFYAKIATRPFHVETVSRVYLHHKILLREFVRE